MRRISKKSLAAKQILQQIIDDKVWETFYWLKCAYETAPDDPQIRQQLTEISADLLKMRRSINETFEEPKK